MSVLVASTTSGQPREMNSADACMLPPTGYASSCTVYEFNRSVLVVLATPEVALNQNRCTKARISAQRGTTDVHQIMRRRKWVHNGGLRITSSHAHQSSTRT